MNSISAAGIQASLRRNRRTASGVPQSQKQPVREFDARDVDTGMRPLRGDEVQVDLYLALARLCDSIENEHEQTREVLSSKLDDLSRALRPPAHPSSKARRMPSMPPKGKVPPASSRRPARAETAPDSTLRSFSKSLRAQVATHFHLEDRNSHEAIDVHAEVRKAIHEVTRTPMAVGSASQQNFEALVKVERYVVHPTDQKRYCWDLSAMILTMYIFLTVPYELVFDDPPESGFRGVLESVILVFFVIDLLLNFNTGFYHQGLVVMNRQAIAKRYLQGWFWIDFVSVVPIEEVISVGVDPRLLRSTKILKLTKTLRLLRVSKMNELVEKINDITGESGVLMLSLVKLMFMLIALATFQACGWWYVTNLESPRYGELNWLQAQGLEERTKFQAFLSCLYFSLTMATTVGFGDIAGTTVAERVYCSACMVAGVATFGALIGDIASTIHEARQTFAESRARVKAAMQVMRSNQVPTMLQVRVQRYLQEMFRLQQAMQRKSELSRELGFSAVAQQVYFAMDGPVLRRHWWLAELTSADMADVCAMVSPRMCSPLDVLWHQNDAGEAEVFVVSGAAIELVFGNKTRRRSFGKAHRGVHHSFQKTTTQTLGSSVVSAQSGSNTGGTQDQIASWLPPMNGLAGGLATAAASTRGGNSATQLNVASLADIVNRLHGGAEGWVSNQEQGDALLRGRARNANDGPLGDPSLFVPCSYEMTAMVMSFTELVELRRSELETALSKSGSPAAECYRRMQFAFAIEYGLGLALDLLYAPCKPGQVNLATDAIQLAPDEDICDSLTRAALAGRPEFIEHLLRNKADVCSVPPGSRSGGSIHSLLAEEPDGREDQRLECLWMLCLHGSTRSGILDRENSDGQTILQLALAAHTPDVMGPVAHLAAATGHSVLQQLLAQRDADVPAPGGSTLLHTAVRRGAVPSVGLLAATHTNAVDHMGRTPLHIAVLQGDESLCNELLQAGAVETCDNLGATPSDLGCATSLDAFAVLRQHDFYGACRRGNLQEMRQLRRPTALRRFSPDGFSGLYLAACALSTEVVADLIDNQADVNSGSTTGLSPLHGALLQSHSADECVLNVLRLLVDARADVRLRPDVPALLSLAVRFGSSVVVYVLEARAEVNPPKEVPPLLRALCRGEAHVNALVEGGCSPKAAFLFALSRLEHPRMASAVQSLLSMSFPKHEMNDVLEAVAQEASRFAHEDLHGPLQTCCEVRAETVAAR